MKGQILGIPKSKYDYEFMVVKETDNGNYLFCSNHEYYDDAQKSAGEVNGVIVHNLRVSHRKLKNGSGELL